MKENKNKDTAQKDYYFPVIVSQIFTTVTVLVLFFFLTRGESGNEILDGYRNLLKEDFLTREFTTAVAGVKEYILSENTFAVFGSRVEQVTDGSVTAEAVTEAAVSEKQENIIPESTTMVFDAEKVSEIAVKTQSSKVSPRSLAVKKTKTQEQAMISPVEEGRYTSYFGERTDPISEGYDYHKGLDIGADEGDRIRAVYDGTVTSVGEDSRSGNYIFLEHKNGYVTFYCHCSEIIAQEGAVIRQGETIALVGSTGYSTGPHLHFEVRKNGESIDPLPLIENAG
ncbi:MAG: M23 family metallopeptidase [Clostridia bacterium]|nr:M23 family metallopeptidase [Clostridia bacterium]